MITLKKDDIKEEITNKLLLHQDTDIDQATLHFSSSSVDELIDDLTSWVIAYVNFSIWFNPESNDESS